MNSLEIPIIFEDKNILILNKPPYLEMEEIYEWLKSRGNNIERGGAAHRLDKDTSGLLLVAKSEEVLKTLMDQFKDREVKKEYISLVHGIFTKEFIVEESLRRNPKAHLKFMVDEAGKPSSTKFTPIDSYSLGEVLKNKLSEDKRVKNQLSKSNYGNFTLVLCQPLTGRTHQIRVHLSYAHFPIVGDQKYGGRKTARIDSIFLDRQFLHAKKIGFQNPDDGNWMEFEAELPKDLKDVLNKLQKLEANNYEQ